ncbi:MAG: 16S rRNA (adenine(1518)-N(6)/adenine(1519)-N(6))-dimethyltransferase RsmA [Candidatus Nanohaloarchaea archaeon]
MDVEKTLRDLGIKPVKGQNFLTSTHVVEALVESGEVEDETVLEIGAGTGVITGELADRAEKVYALEKDTTLAAHLEDRFSGTENVEVVNEDFFDYEIPEVDRCVSNLPFEISSDAIEKLGERQVQSSLILQKELAERMVADPGDPEYGPFTVLSNYYFVPVKLKDVPGHCYYPEPEVDTSIVKLYPNRERHGVEDEDRFFRMSKALFTHKKKKARNAFVDARHILDISKDRAKEVRDDIPHSEKRVFQLELREIADIAEAFSGIQER